ncbi:MAG TPA: AMP-binding protein, partial [Candidatus Aquabacterium excrementipullorum]|nr:AMP-binding protein [Candidatus Aquabacterium excrementipullorum]
AAWHAAFAAKADPCWALYQDDPLVFSAALMGAWHAGKTVVLPGDDLPATLDLLRERGCAFAGALPGGLQAVAGHVTADALVAAGPLDLAQARLQVFTSGSQGQPVAIDKTLLQLSLELDVLQATFASNDDDGATVWATVSHQHIYGLLFLVLWPLRAGRSLARRRLLYPEDIAQHVGRHGPAWLVTTPAHLKRLSSHLDWSGARAALRAVFSSGGPLPFEVSRDTAGLLGHTPVEVLGSSETGGMAWRRAVHADVPWTPLADVDWRADADGTLCIRATRVAGDAWWATGDRVEALPGGGFRLLGRGDRIAKIEEKRISLAAIEQALVGTPWVAEARALVVDTPIGPRIGVVAVPTSAGWHEAGQGKRVLGDRLRQALVDRIEPVGLPRRWRFVEALPLNAQGKVTQPLLLALFNAQDTADDATEASADTRAADFPPVQWHQRDESQALAELDIHAGLHVFKGHFPEAPILPGVAQLHWAITLARQCFDVPTHFVRMEVLKFMRPVQPGTTLMADLRWGGVASDPTLASLTFKLYSLQGDARTEHASGKVLWSRALSPQPTQDAAHHG